MPKDPEKVRLWGKSGSERQRVKPTRLTHLGRVGDRLFGAPISLPASLRPEREAGDRSDTLAERQSDAAPGHD
jgi:hypothetical protein